MTNRSNVFQRFLEIARLLADGKSLRQASKGLKMQFSSAREVIQRMEVRYGVQIVVKDHAKSGDSRLTEDGHELLRRAERLFEWNPSRDKPSLSVAVPQSILDSQVVSLGLRRLIEGREGTKLEVSVRPTTELARVCADIGAGAIDIGMVWVASRARASEFVRGRGVVAEYCPTPFGIVALTHSVELHAELMEQLYGRDLVEGRAPDFASAGQWLGGKRIALLSREHQPYYDELTQAIEEPTPDTGCVRVETIDAAISHVAMKAVEFAFVPYLPSLMRQHHLAGSLCFSEPIGGVDLAILISSRRTSDQRVRSVVSQLQSLLSEEATFGEEDDIELVGFPDDVAEIAALKIGFYIDGDRLLQHGAKKPTSARELAAYWRWETVELRQIGTPVSASVPHGYVERDAFFEGTVRNRFGHVFSVQSHAVLDNQHGRMIVSATQVRETDESDLATEASVEGFVSVLNSCVRFKDGALALTGLWTGHDRSDSPAVYATVWSQRSLDRHELYAVARSTLMRVVLLADCDREFVNQPQVQVVGHHS